MKSDRRAGTRAWNQPTAHYKVTSIKCNLYYSLMILTQKEIWLQRNWISVIEINPIILWFAICMACKMVEKNKYESKKIWWHLSENFLKLFRQKLDF